MIWSIITPKEFLNCCKGSRPHIRLPNLGIQQRDWVSPGNLALKIIWSWLQNFHSPRGNGDSWRVQTKPCAHQDPGKRSSDPRRDWARRACECLRVSWGGVCWQWPATGTAALVLAAVGGAAEVLLGAKSSCRRSPLACRRACRLQDWATLGQITSKEGAKQHL